jgi:hypothetical protein
MTGDSSLDPSVGFVDHDLRSRCRRPSPQAVAGIAVSTMSALLW